MGKHSSKNLLLVILSVLFIGTTSAAVYLLLKLPKESIILDKYSDLRDICDSEKADENFTTTCNGLLLSINNPADQQSCFELQIVTTSNELKNISLCESNEIFKYSNEILNYKKLLPVTFTLNYAITTESNSFTLETITFALLSEEYLQNEVNRDIQNLVNIDPSSTTIQNSVDFCPLPTLLPDYITEQNKQRYTEYYNDHVLAEEGYKAIYSEEFQTNFIDNGTNSLIRILFGCESSERRGLNNLCEQELPSRYYDIGLQNVPTFVSDWETQTNTKEDLSYIKNVSLIYDGILYKQDHLYYSSPHIINELFQIQNDTPGNQNVFCYESKLYNLLKKNNPDIQSSINLVNTLLDQNLQKISPSCAEMLDATIYNKNGRYLKSLYTIKNGTTFTIYEKCNNLYLLIANE